MRIGVLKETWPGELRTAIVPAGAKRLVNLGCEIVAETGIGKASGFVDREYSEAGVTMLDDADAVLTNADVVMRVRQPDEATVAKLPHGCIHISFLDPFGSRSVVDAMSAKGVQAVSMQMIPRSTRAQKMDALSSQANLAGYVTVILAAHHSRKAFPMMMTPSGTIRPAKVFVIGAGVAGLQAIATAKRLGARVEAFDTRPVVAEQVRSLGAKFVEIDLGEVGQTEQGYAKALTEEQIKLQKEGQKQVIASSDVVITTAQLFGRPAPLLVTHDMLQAMQPGSVVVDMAVESGGNVEGSVLDEVVQVEGVNVIGLGNLPSHVSRNASEMYGNNLINLIEEFWDDEAKRVVLNPDDEIVQAAVLCRDGQIVHEMLLSNQ